jgi:hypothetical protein
MAPIQEGMRQVCFGLQYKENDLNGLIQNGGIAAWRYMLL